MAQAVVGRFAPHHAFMITEQLSHLDYLDEAMERVSTEIEQRLQEEWAAVELLDSVPGISQRAAEIVVAELGLICNDFRVPSTWRPGLACVRAIRKAEASGSVGKHGRGMSGCAKC